MPTTADLARMRATVNGSTDCGGPSGFLPDTCSLYAKQETNGARGQVVTLGALVATVACSKGTALVQQQTFGGGFVTVKVPMFRVPAGTAVTEKQVLIHQGTTYEITEVRDRGTWAISVQVLVKAVVVGA